MDATKTVDERTSLLVAQMTVEEKVAQMLGDGEGEPGTLKRYERTGVGSTGMQIATLEDLAQQNALQAAMINSSRLGIPVDFTAETLHSGGHPGCTVFPMPAGQGASWNRTLVHAIAASNALQARASGTNHGLSPVINVATDPRFGRFQEAFGEDPFIVGTMAAAAVRGLQGDDGAGGPGSYLGSPGERIIAQAKHFFAYDYGGRDGAGALLDERSLAEVYGRPWQRAIAEAGLRGAMASHNAVNREPMHGSRRWLTTYLREELGFGNGYIGADSHNILALFSAQKVVPSIEAAAALAVTAGLDQDLNTMVGTPFLTLVNQSKTPALSAAIDRAAGNVLRLKFAAGLFDQPHANTSRWGARDSPAARELAREAAEQSVVLLINRPVDGQKALPLDRAAVKRIAVIGPNGDQKDNTLGDCERSNGRPQPISPRLTPTVAANRQPERGKEREGVAGRKQNSGDRAWWAAGLRRAA